MPQMVLVTWHLSAFFNHRAVCKCTHVYFLFTVKPRGTGKGTEKTLLVLRPQNQGHSSCLSAGDIRIPRVFQLPSAVQESS